MSPTVILPPQSFHGITVGGKQERYQRALTRKRRANSAPRSAPSVRGGSVRRGDTAGCHPPHPRQSSDLVPQSHLDRYAIPAPGDWRRAADSEGLEPFHSPSLRNQPEETGSASSLPP